MILKRKYLLVEMAVVAGVLLILVVVMLPRFYQSQIRAQLTLTYERMNGINQANQAYKLDYGEYAGYPDGMWKLTTPTAYLADWNSFMDPFKERAYGEVRGNPADSRFHFTWNDVRFKAKDEMHGVDFYYHGIHVEAVEYVFRSNGPSNKPYSSFEIKNEVIHFQGGYHLSNGLMSLGIILATDKRVFGGAEE